jgi:hypothetical protein
MLQWILHPPTLLKQLGHLLFLLVPPTFSWVLFGHFGPFLFAPTQEYYLPFGRLMIVQFVSIL